MPDKLNRSRASKFRELVALFLRSEGVPIKTRKVAYKLSDRISPDHPQSHLTGMDRWAIMTRNERTQDFSGALDSACTAASLDGKERAAVIQFRATRPVAEAFVTMTLETFSEVLRDELERVKP